MRNQAVLLILFLSSLLIAWLIASTPPLFPMALVLGTSVLILTLIDIRIALTGLLFSMLFSPELTIAEVPGRSVVVRADDLILIVIFLTWFIRMGIFKEIGLIRKTPLNRPILIFLALAVLSTLRGTILGLVDFKRAFFYLLKISEYAMVYFMVANVVHTEKEAKKFYTFFWVAALLVVGYGYYNFLKGNQVFVPFDDEPATASGYFLILFGQCLGLMFFHPSAGIRYGAGGLFFLLIPLLARTFSRAGYISFIFMMFCSLFLLRRKRYLWITGLSFVLIAPAVIKVSRKDILFLKFLKEASERWQYTFTGSYELAGLGFEPSAAARLESWKINTRLHFLSHPLLGVGITGTGFIDSQYVRYLNELGLAGLAAFLALLFFVYKNLKMLLNQREAIMYLPFGILLSFTGLLIHAITSNTFIIVRIMEPFWFLMALAFHKTQDETV